MDSATPGLWLFSKKFDLLLLVLPGIYLSALYVPFFLSGMNVSYVFALYLFHHIFFSYPHMYTGGSTVIDDLKSRRMAKWPVVGCLLVSVALLCGLLAADNSGLIILGSVVTWAGIYHQFMQHLGIVRIYNRVQERRSPGFLPVSDQRLIEVAFIFLTNAGLVWSFSQPQFEYFLLPGLKFYLHRPTLPWNGFIAYAVITTAIVLFLGYRLFVARRSERLPLPVPQILFLVICPVSCILPYAFLPEYAYALMFIMGTIFHDVQYMGFVWGYEKHKGRAPLRPLRYLGRAFAFAGIMVVIGYFTGFFGAFVTFLTFTFAHYLIDGFIWKRKYNGNLPRFFDSLTRGPSPEGAP